MHTQIDGSRYTIVSDGNTERIYILNITYITNPGDSQVRVPNVASKQFNPSRYNSTKYNPSMVTISISHGVINFFQNPSMYIGCV